jgi:hemin uptake protein HemP
MKNEPQAQQPPVSSQTGTDWPRIESQQILRGHNTIEIEHAGQRYLLRVTRENKLILTK